MEMSGSAGEEENCIVPLLTFWYLNQAYRKEVERIERDNGVKITTDVRVSIKGDQPGGDPHKALSEFTDLVQNYTDTRELDSCSICLDQTDARDIHTLMKLQKGDAKLALAASSEKAIVYGPKQSISSVRKALGLGHNSSTNSMASSGSEYEPRKITMEIKDPLVANGLSMDRGLWELMSTAFCQKINNIEGKFGVQFKPQQELSQHKVIVHALPSGDGQAASLESHAFRALVHLYQRVATSTMSCYLQASDQKTAVRDELKEICAQHPLVRPEFNGPWGLIGLPQHLGPAVTELEERLGRPVFKEEDKQRIGYAGDQGSSAGAAWDGGGATGDEEEETCPICMDKFQDKQKLKCSHEFCRDCLKSAVHASGPSCPVCKDVFGKVEGDQPPGRMDVHKQASQHLPGFKCGTIIIQYDIPSGRQTERHPHPGKQYAGTQRTAYLPDNNEGNEVLKLLQRAFDQKVIFTVGTSRTTGRDDCVTWNDIHHKTNIYGGPQSFGYPDPDYMNRVKDELKAKGIK